MPRRHLVLIGIVLLVATSALAKDTRAELRVTLRFTSGENLNDEKPDDVGRLRSHSVELHVADGRKAEAPADLGEGTNDDDLTFPIRATGEVLPFVTESLQRMAGAWGIELADSATRRLELTVDRIHVEEGNKAVGSVYRAEVELGFVLRDGKGKKLVAGTVPGDATRYGKARSGENANEVLNDALLEAFADMLADSDLQEAWVSGS